MTLAEYQAGCISRMVGATEAAATALLHLESMVGAIDDLMYKTNPQVYAGSGTVRKALAEQRAQALKELQDAARS
jgi:23S rRNA A2030 N6-methylase RlmJ